MVLVENDKSFQTITPDAPNYSAAACGLRVDDQRQNPQPTSQAIARPMNL